MGRRRDARRGLACGGTRQATGASGGQPASCCRRQRQCTLSRARRERQSQQRERDRTEKGNWCHRHSNEEGSRRLQMPSDGDSLLQDSATEARASMTKDLLSLPPPLLVSRVARRLTSVTPLSILSPDCLLIIPVSLSPTSSSSSSLAFLVHLSPDPLCRRRLMLHFSA